MTELDGKSVNGPKSEVVVLGKFAGHFGIKGWLKVFSYTRPTDEIFEHPVLWVRDSLSSKGWKSLQIQQFRSQEKRLSAKIKGIDSREQAEHLVNCEIGIPNDQLPSLAEGEFYWSELIGLKVKNLQDEELGVIDHVLETGANDVLVLTYSVNDEIVLTSSSKGNETQLERLIPWTKNVVREVNLDQKSMTVDWDSDF